MRNRHIENLRNRLRLQQNVERGAKVRVDSEQDKIAALLGENKQAPRADAMQKQVASVTADKDATGKSTKAPERPVAEARNNTGKAPALNIG